MRTFIQAVTFIVISLLVACSQTGTPEKTYVVVTFDVEDYISPPETEVDEIPMWLAETMSEVGVTGTFFVIGEKARSLEARGRQDVLQAMARHDIGSHTNFGSIHPTVTEILEEAGWEEGVSAMRQNEAAGFEELERIFGVPVSTLARHGGSYGPQLVYALGEMGKGYVYSPFQVPGHYAMWFCNALNFYGDYGYFDDFYYRDDLFNPVFDSLKHNFEADTRGKDVISFFACHPTKVRAEQFWDFNFYEGANPPLDSLLPPELRPAERMETARKNFKRLMQFLKEQEYIEITTYSDLMQRFSWQPESVSQKDLIRIAETLRDQQKIRMDDYYSPAELFAALVSSLDHYAAEGEMPRELNRDDPLGPLSMPPEEPGLEEVSSEEALRLAREAHAYIQSQHCLPAQLQSENQVIGTGTLYYLFASIYLDLSKGEMKNAYDLHSMEAFPREHEEVIIADVEACKHWIVHKPDLDMSHLADLTRMQLWTLKPAHEK